jgi:SAM-dependent methyltransferase
MTDGEDVVREQYESWVYPRPVDDLDAWTAEGHYEMSDPSLIRRKIWPRKVEPDALEILVAGCGSNQAAALAYANRDCRVTGVDISEASLANQRRLQRKHKLDNLELHNMPIERVSELGPQFDYIVSTGVLHHMPDPDLGLRSLRDMLAPHGVMSIMLYGQEGRAGVYMLQEALRLLGASQDADGVALARHLVELTPDWHPIHRYLEMAPDFDYDAGVVDTLLHRSDRAYTVPEVFAFARDNGLKFQSWLDNMHYALSVRVGDSEDPLRKLADGLDAESQARLLEVLYQSSFAHRLLLCHPERPESDYTLDFTGDGWLDYIPSLRPPIDVVFRQTVRSATMHGDAGVMSGALERNTQVGPLNAFGVALLDGVDGTTPIRAILDGAAEAAKAWGWDRSQAADAAREFFALMAEWDHLLYRIP